MRALASLAAAVALSACGGGEPRVVVELSAPANLSAYDLYVRADGPPLQRQLRTGFSSLNGRDVSQERFRIGLTLPRAGRYAIAVVGVVGPVDGAHADWTQPGARQFFWARPLDAGGDTTLDARLLEVAQSEDGDGDAIPGGAWSMQQGTPAALLDCDDKTPTVNPFVEREICGDGVDENCDGNGDEGCLDSDGDGDPDATDCAPTDPRIHHGNAKDPFPESANCCGYSLGMPMSGDLSKDPRCHAGTCDDGVDEDCDGVDVKCVRDQDCDGEPASAKQLAGCSAPPNVPSGGDCDDCDPTINTRAPEICDGKDNNCNGLIDETCVACDLDGDGFQGARGMDCPDAMYKASGKPVDCDDEDAGVFPGSTNAMHPVRIPQLVQAGQATCKDAEAGTACGALRQACRWPGLAVPAPVDVDCSGAVMCPLVACDADGDGFPANKNGCGAGPFDCDDADPHTFPGAPERCGDGKAQGCVQDVACASDGDGDGYNANVDCDDGNKAVHPWAAEPCNGVDDDCDGLVDEGDPDLTGATMAGQKCTDSNVGACALGQGRCVCSASTLQGLHFDAKRALCPTETTAADLAVGAAPRCYGAGQPTPEICNGIDDDCDPATSDGAIDCPSACCGAAGCADTIVNCGMCGSACNLPHATPSCTSMMCGIQSCAAGWSNCNAVVSDGCEVQTGSDPQHCGSCSSPCAPTANVAAPGCANGQCTVGSCSSGFGDCNASYSDGCEVNLGSSTTHCGSCGLSCLNPRIGDACSNGGCICNGGGACDPSAYACKAGTGCRLKSGQSCNHNKDCYSGTCSGGTCT